MNTSNVGNGNGSTDTPSIRDDRAPRHLSISNEHATPLEVIAAARALMGRIDLDPASCTLAQTRVEATTWFGLDHPTPHLRDGLSIMWCDTLDPTPDGCDVRVFLNPPGGKAEGASSAKRWWFKLAKEYALDHIREAVFLGFSVELLQTTQVVETFTALTIGGGDAGTHPLPIPLDFPICIPSRRLRFDKMIAHCTFCHKAIDDTRLKMIQPERWDKSGLCAPDTCAHGWTDDILWIRNTASIGPLGFQRGDSPPHSNVIVYLPPKDTDPVDAAARFQAAFAAIGRVR